MHGLRQKLWAIGAAGIALLAGCAAASRPVPVNRRLAGADRGHLNADQAVDSDPCAVRLQNIEGVMLQYFALNHHLPPTLDELLPLSDLDQPLSFICPDTGRPYTYVPAGLSSANQQKKIIVYDSVPHPNGSRWCILMPPAIGRKSGSLSMEVVALPEAAFRQFYPPD